METYRLFIIINPGLEDLALKELMEKCPVSDAELMKGGIEVTADLEWIERAHQVLKIPTRILMRIIHFKVRDFPKLYQKFATFSWNKFLSHPNPSFEISCTKSRLNHTGRIDETIRKALDEALVRQPLKKDWEKKNYPPQTFYVRFFDDELTLSLDLTGEPLYKRGLMKIKGEAPIRESLAAAMVYEIFQGLTEKHDLVDPMCGSGTLLIEAQTFNEPLHFRTFAFETAPFYKGKLLRMTTATKALPVKETFGFDLNEEILFKVKAELGDEFPLKLEALNSIETKLNLPEDCIMICNPPYGERLKIKGQRGSFLKEAWHKFLSEDKPLRFGWVLPSDMDDLFSRPDGYKCLQKRHFRNGGMAVTFWIWERLP